MSGFTVERYGYISAPQLIADVVGDLTANGFTIKYTNKTSATWNSTSFQYTDVYQVILEAGTTVDPLAANQAWRVIFDVRGPQTCACALGNAVTLTNGGIIAIIPQPAAGQGQTAPPNEWVGILGTEAIASSVTVENRANRFIDRTGGTLPISSPAMAASRPMSYRLTVTPRGIVLYVWEEGVNEDGRYSSWFVVQRPVDRDTGLVLQTGKCPVFAVYSLYGVIKKFVVREVDILRPSPSVSATADTADSNWIINDQQQVSIAEGNLYVTTFPSRLNTPRYAYTQVLDLICTTSADVVAEWTDVPITVFGESSSRTYKAMTANGNYNTNMRVLVLEQGGGI
jgi:hypothetical protein